MTAAWDFSLCIPDWDSETTKEETSPQKSKPSIWHRHIGSALGIGSTQPDNAGSAGLISKALSFCSSSSLPIWYNKLPFTYRVNMLYLKCLSVINHSPLWGSIRPNINRAKKLFRAFGEFFGFPASHFSYCNVCVKMLVWVLPCRIQKKKNVPFVLNTTSRYLAIFCVLWQYHLAFICWVPQENVPFLLACMMPDKMIEYTKG